MTPIDSSTSKNPLFLIVVIWTLVGCVGTFETGTLSPMGSGFKANLPEPGTRVVVWGNHADAVDQTSTWLHQHGLVIIDRTRLQQGLEEQQGRLSGSSKDWAQILEAGDRIGADLVTFVEVTNVHSGRKFELTQVRYAPDFQLNVEVRGVKAGTGEIVSKGKAWQDSVNSEVGKVIEELTTEALEWTWVTSGLDGDTQKTVGKAMPIETPAASQPRPASSAAVSQKKDTAIFAGPAVVTEPESNEAFSPLDQKNSEVLEFDQIQSQSESRPQGESLEMPAPAHQFPDPDDLSSVTRQEEPAILAGPAVVTVPEPNEAFSPSESKQSEVLELDQPNPQSQGEPLPSNEITSDYLEEFEPMQSSANDPQKSELGLQLASGALSLLYSPVKLIYAGIGGVVGGVAYVLSVGDREVADSIWVASVDGTYFLTPAHLRGEEPVYFKGISEKELASNDMAQAASLAQSAAHQP